MSLLAALASDSAFPWAGPANIVVDGNSIYTALYGSIGAFSTHIFLEQPFASSGFTHADCAITSQTWQQMTDTAADVDAAYVSGKTNVLVVSETTNTIYSFSNTAATAISTSTAYLTRVRSAHPDWIILLAGSLPAQGSWDASGDLSRNLQMIDADNYMAANYVAMGADGYIGFRDLAPFVGTGTTTPYADFADCWHDHIHPSDIGKVYMRARVVQGLLALPAAH